MIGRQQGGVSLKLGTKRETPWGYWIESSSGVLAGVIKADYKPTNVAFVTPNEFGLQVAIMNRSSGHEVPSHEHLPVDRAVSGTQEVLLIRAGGLRADLYDKRIYVGSVRLGVGDTIILNSGGHGFVATKDCLFVEVKQGPYVEGRDKVIFDSGLHNGQEVEYLD